MADDFQAPDRPRLSRKTKLQFGRAATPKLKTGRPVLRYIGAAAVLSAFVAVTVMYGPPGLTKHGFFHNWFVSRRDAEKQRETEEKLRQALQAKRDMEALQQKSKAESDAARMKLDEQMQSLQQPAPQEKQAEDKQASTPAAGEDLAAAAQNQPLIAHEDAVVWLSVSPDGSELLSASIDKSIKLWDIKTGLLARNIGRHGDMVRSALFLPGGSEVLSGADDGLIDIWSVDQGKLENTLVARENGGVRGLAISADGRLAVSSHQSGAVVVWDLRKYSKLHVLDGHQWPVNAVAISPDGTLAISGDINGVIRTWDVQTGKSLRLWKGHERGVYGAAFLPDGKQVVTAGGGGMLELWNVDSGQEVRSFSGHAATVYAVSVSADGLTMLSGSLDGTTRLWDLSTGEELGYFDNSGGRIYSVALLPDGSAAIGDESGTIKIITDRFASVRIFSAKPAQ